MGEGRVRGDISIFSQLPFSMGGSASIVLITDNHDPHYQSLAQLKLKFKGVERASRFIIYCES
jgi:hypothetical protein